MQRRGKTAVKTLAIVAALGLAGDLVYSLVVARQVRAWEATVERDPDGVQRGCRAYTLDAQPAAPESGGGSGAALLLVHGINASPQHYAKMAPRLSERGFACRVMRLPGFAEPIDRYAGTTAQQWKDAVRGELAELRAEHRRVGVVAHSLGGATAIGALIDEPAAADFAVLLAPAAGVSNRRSPLLSTRAWHEIGRRLLLFTTVVRSPFGIDSHDPENADYPGRAPFTPRPVLNELFDLIDDNWRRAPEYQTPTLMVLTRDDLVVDWRAAERYYEQMSATPKQLLFLPDSGHAIPIDYGWRETTEAIRGFANELDSRH